MNQRRQFATLILITAFLFGLFIRLAAPINASGPVNDGGLFFQMTRDLQNNHFALPNTATYNDANIPFAYPPFGFYLTGGIQKITHISLFTLFTYLPAIFSTLAILAFYFLALQFTNDPLKASLAALFYAMIPKSFDWAIMGGGVTRAPALCFSFLTLAFAYRLFTTKDSRNILPTSIFAVLLALTHPEITFQTAFSVFVLALFFLRGRKSFLHSFIVAVIVVLLTSAWWATVLTQHGLAPFQAALGAHPRDLATSLLYLFQFNLSGEAILAVVAVLGLIGLIRDFRHHDFFLPAWIGLSFLSDPRAAPFASLTPLILLAVKGFESTLKGLGETSPMEEGFTSRFARYVLFGTIAYLFLSGMIAAMQFGNQFRLLPEERQALNWIVNNTSTESQFLVLTGDAALSDPLSEWFPALTERVNIVTPQGHEWTPDLSLIENMKAYSQAQSCLNEDANCLSKWNFDYLYIRKIRPQAEGGVQGQVSLLEKALQNSSEYSVVYELDVAIIFLRGKPMSNTMGPANSSHMAVWSP
ncbi:MAG: 6-pyruvoyl-tetrahydropterin synthase-related protein [Anaerolineales bacterium]